MLVNIIMIVPFMLVFFLCTLIKAKCMKIRQQRNLMIPKHSLCFQKILTRERRGTEDSGPEEMTMESGGTEDSGPEVT